MNLSLIIPAYNEAARLPAFAVAARAYLPAVFGSDYEVIVVDDGSEDGTGEYVRQLAASWA